jgi:hypothetical protein
MASILSRQRNMALQQIQAREEVKKAELEAKAKAKALVGRPPRYPAGPLQKLPPTGIATMRRQNGMGRRKRHDVKKSRKNKRRI